MDFWQTIECGNIGIYVLCKSSTVCPEFVLFLDCARVAAWLRSDLS